MLQIEGTATLNGTPVAIPMVYEAETDDESQAWVEFASHVANSYAALSGAVSVDLHSKSQTVTFYDAEGSSVDVAVSVTSVTVI